MDHVLKEGMHHHFTNKFNKYLVAQIQTLRVLLFNTLCNLSSIDKELVPSWEAMVHLSLKVSECFLFLYSVNI